MEFEVKKKTNKKSLYAIIAVVFLGVIGVTFAYYQTNNTLTNEFNAGKYKIKTEEVFVSPDNWQPGDVTEKKVNVTNEGTIDAAVKVCFRQKWEDEDGNPLELKGVSLNFADYANAYWKEDCDNYENQFCFYYYKKLEPWETTENLLETVEFIKRTNYDSTTTCTEDSTTHTKTCTSEIDGYSGGKYTLYIDIETVQYNSYQYIWNNPKIITDFNNHQCEDLNIKKTIPDTTGVVSYLFNGNILLKDNELNNFDLTDATCKVVYIDNVAEENKYNECFGAKYIDGTNHYDGETVILKSFNDLYYDLFPNGYEILDEYENIILNSQNINTLNNALVNYSKRVMIENYYKFSDNDKETMNFSAIRWDNWDSNRSLSLLPNGSFNMPNHGVLFEFNLIPGVE